MHNQIMNYNTKGRPATRQPARPGKPGSPVDPDELSRRLFLVLADQKAAAERKKRAAKLEAAAAAAKSSSSSSAAATTTTAAAAAAGVQNSSYPKSTTDPLAPRGLVVRKSMSIFGVAKRKSSKAAMNVQQEEGGPYVPREAAAQFALTTTALNMREGGGLVHKLSRNALKFHLEGDHVDRNTPVAEQTKALRRAQSKREQLHERNQFQRTRILEEAAEIDEMEHRHSHNIQNHRHTFTGGLAGTGTAAATGQGRDQQNQRNRRSSTGDLLEKFERCDKEFEEHRHVLPIPPASPGHREDSPPPKYFPSQDPAEHRVDWTQSDEPRFIQKAKTVPLTPLIKRPVSIWALRGRLGSRDSKHGRGDKEEGTNGADASSPELQKTPKVGFFSRFRR